MDIVDAGVICPYCQQQTKLVTGEVVYPHRPDLYSKYFYLCSPCAAYVGCHSGTTIPLGVVANAELRKYKSLAHAVFDPIWQYGGVKRKHAYYLLSKVLGIPFKECHIGNMSIDQCKAVLRACSDGSLANIAEGKAVQEAIKAVTKLLRRDSANG